MTNCDAAGAAQAKTGKNRTVLDRHAGMVSTTDAMQSKTRSGHPASSKHNQWESASCCYGDNENIHGYSKGGNGGCSK